MGIFPLDLIVGNATECGAKGNYVDLMYDRRQVALKGKESNKTTRTSSTYPIEAFFENRVLNLNFISKLSNLTVIVTNVDANDIIIKRLLLCI